MDRPGAAHLLQRSAAHRTEAGYLRRRAIGAARTTGRTQQDSVALVDTAHWLCDVWTQLAARAEFIVGGVTSEITLSGLLPDDDERV